MSYVIYLRSPVNLDSPDRDLRLDVNEFECQFLFVTLADIAQHQPVVVKRVGGERSFRRRLMEMGLVPGTRVTLEKVAPFGDPLELRARGCTLSIRAAEAKRVDVEVP